MPIDLHTHSTYSDGSDSPADLVAQAALARLEAVALTDHDNLNGIVEAREAADQHGIELVSGVELSCEWPGATMHLLVYYLEPVPGPLQDRLADLQHHRATRNDRIIERLQELGVDITMDEVVEQAGGTGVGRPHFAAVMVRKGVVPDPQTAFDRYLAKGQPAYVERARLEPLEAIKLARHSGALPVVAHPHTLGIKPEQAETALGELAAEGLVGMECWYAEYEPSLRQRYAVVARSMGLVPTGGTDYHGSYKAHLELGIGRGDLSVPATVLEELQAARAEINTD